MSESMLPPEPAPAPAPARQPLLGSATLASIALRANLLQATWNFERQQGIGWAYALQPALEKLYPDAAPKTDATTAASGQTADAPKTEGSTAKDGTQNGNSGDGKKESTSKKKKGLRKIIPW